MLYLLISQLLKFYYILFAKLTILFISSLTNLSLSKLNITSLVEYLEALRHGQIT